MIEKQNHAPHLQTESRTAEVQELREAELQMTGHAPAATHFAGWNARLPTTAQGEAAQSKGNPTPAVKVRAESGSPS